MSTDKTIGGLDRLRPRTKIEAFAWIERVTDDLDRAGFPVALASAARLHLALDKLLESESPAVTWCQMSKRIGLDEPEDRPTWPNLERARELHALAAVGGENAFETLFRLNRFAASPTDKERPAAEVCHSGLHRAHRFFDRA